MRFGRIIDPFLGERGPLAMAQTGLLMQARRITDRRSSAARIYASPEAWDGAVGRYRAHPGPMGYSDDMTAR